MKVQLLRMQFFIFNKLLKFSTTVASLVIFSYDIHTSDRRNAVHPKVRTFLVLTFLSVYLLFECKIIRRTTVDASVLKWGQNKTRKLYLSVIPYPLQFCINNTEASFVIVYCCNQWQYKLCVNFGPLNVLVFECKYSSLQEN